MLLLYFIASRGSFDSEKGVGVKVFYRFLRSVSEDERIKTILDIES